MQIETIFGIVLWSVAGVALAAYLIGMAVGRRSEEWTRPGGAIALIAFVLFVVIYGVATPLATKVGPVVSYLAYRMILMLDAAMIGGFATGRMVRVRSRRGIAFRSLATVVIVSGSLSQFAGRGNDLVATAKRVGIGGPAQKLQPEAVGDCRANLKHIYDAFATYAQDWDAFPPAATWTTAIQDQELFREHPDWKRDWFHCPAAGAGQAGYAFNAALSCRKLKGQPIASMPNAAVTPVVYDSSAAGSNAHDSFASLPKPGRHSGGDNVVYCDGHTEPVRPK